MDPIWYKHYQKGVRPNIDIPPTQTVANLLDEACQAYQHKEALTCMGAGITFRQLSRRADDFASYLQNHLKIQKGDRIAIMLPNIIQFPIALYGSLKIGAVCVNTNPLYTPREMRHQFNDAGAKVLVILDLFMDKLEEIIKETKIEHVIVTSIGDQLPILKGAIVKAVLKLKRQVPKHSLQATPFSQVLSKGAAQKYQPPSIHQDDVAILQYTGGTTGVSKGAMLTQKNLLANIYQIRELAVPILIPGAEVVLTALPLYHVFALSVNFLSFLSLGGRMILCPKPVPIENTVKLFKQYNITVMTGVNTLYNAMNNSKVFQELAPRTIKIALAGAMTLQRSVADKFQAITGTRIKEGFGLTEASPVTHCSPLFKDSPIGSIGVPLPSTLAKVCDENGNEVGPNEVGELCVKGPQVMKGYWLRDDETKKVIRDGWLWTGDMARMDEDGYFYIVDRKKDMIIVSGFNVYPNEVEEVLASHPKVLEAAVLGEKARDGSEIVKAFVVKKDESLTEEELKRYCEHELTNYKRPRSYEFRTELPKTNVGKILRRALKADAQT